jgi:type IV pilus biogenesis protein CpaD/CtpE
MSSNRTARMPVTLSARRPRWEAAVIRFGRRGLEALVSKPDEAALEMAVSEALRHLTPLERRMCRGVIRRNLAQPKSTLSILIPKSGIESATDAIVANVWALLVGVTVIPAAFLGEGGRRGPIRVSIAACLGFIGAISALFWLYRVFTALRARRLYKRRTTSNSSD